jgi:predicted ATP-grasp superfamily ATP-dependent carboligase
VEKLNLMVLGLGKDQLPAISHAISLGLGVIGCDGNPKAVGFEFCDESKVLDIRNPDEVEKYALEMNKKVGLDGVFTPAVEVGPSVGRVVDKLGLHGISESTAIQLTDKIVRHQAFDEYKIPSTRWGRCYKDIDGRLKAPFVIKPKGKCAADGVKYVEKQEQLWTEEFDLIEEYIKGWELSVEVLVFEPPQFIFCIADRNYEGTYHPYMVENGCSLPSKIPAKINRKIQILIRRLIQSFNLKRCAIKLDLVVKDNIVYVLECAPRLGGGKLSSTMIQMAYGTDWWKLAIKIAMGFPIEQEEITPSVKKCVVQRYKFPKGEIKSNRDREFSVECDGETFEEAEKEALKCTS